MKLKVVLGGHALKNDLPVRGVRDNSSPPFSSADPEQGMVNP